MDGLKRDGLDPLYDELLVLLEAIEEVHSDAEEKRRARTRVTMAGVARLERDRGGAGAAETFERRWPLRRRAGRRRREG